MAFQRIMVNLRDGHNEKENLISERKSTEEEIVLNIYYMVKSYVLIG